MEADTADIDFADAAFTLAGTDRSMQIEQVAKASFTPVGIAVGARRRLAGRRRVLTGCADFPGGFTFGIEHIVAAIGPENAAKIRESRGSRPRRATSRQRRTVRWRKQDSNFESRPERSGRSEPRYMDTRPLGQPQPPIPAEHRTLIAPGKRCRRI